MTISRIEGEGFFQIENFLGKEQINQAIEPILPQFNQLMKSYVNFNLFFLMIGVVEFSSFLFFFTFFEHSSILTLSLALVFLTFFSYLVLRIYLQERKPAKFKELKDRYIQSCKVMLNYQEGTSKHHIALANACCKFADSLHGIEFQFYPLPRWLGLGLFISLIKRLSCWCHWHDVHQMKELLLLSSVEENIKLIQCEPTSLEGHASLGNAYVMLSGLYVHPSKIDGDTELRGVPSAKFSILLDQKFHMTAKRAIEEFKILNDYAPDDPWVHAQLAYSYHDLKMPNEEIREYEILTTLNPNDKEAAFKLGVLYFQQERNADGLRIFEQFKREKNPKAEELIKCYGSYNVLEFSRN